MRVSQKFLTYVVIGALVAALFISCKSNENPDSGGEVAGENPPDGTYTIGGDKATVSADGTIIGELIDFSVNPSQKVNFNVKVNNWYKHSNYDTHYVKERRKL